MVNKGSYVVLRPPPLAMQSLAHVLENCQLNNTCEWWPPWFKTVLSCVCVYLTPPFPAQPNRRLKRGMSSWPRSWARRRSTSPRLDPKLPLSNCNRYASACTWFRAIVLKSDLVVCSVITFRCIHTTRSDLWCVTDRMDLWCKPITGFAV